MPTLADIKNQLKKTIDYIKQNPILDAAATSLLQEIPLVGGFLVKLYDRAGGSADDKSKIILKCIEQLLQLNEEQLNKISKDLEDNRDVIIKNIIENRIVITDLISKSVAEILETITKVEDAFREDLVTFNLQQSGISLYTPELRFNPGEKSCWITGIFTIREINSGYDARRSITDEIIKSVENNKGTIVYGAPFTGKSVLLKRALLELIRNGYAVLYADNVEAESNDLQGLLESTSKKYNKVVFIVDNVHKSSGEPVFQAYNDIKTGKVKFLFAAREKQLDKNRPEKDRPETTIALSKIAAESQFTIEFNEDYANLLFNKGIDVQDTDNPRRIDYAKTLYHYSQGDPLMYNLGLKYYLSGARDSLENFIEREMLDVMKQLDHFKNPSIWNAAIFASLIGILDLRLNLSQPPELLSCSPITLDDIRLLGKESILLRETDSDTYRIRHEVFSYEFLSLLYKRRFGNISKKFDQNYDIKKIIKCIWTNINVHSIIDMLNICSFLQVKERYSALSILISSNYVVPADSYVIPSNLKKDEKVRLLCYGLGNFYSSISDYNNSLAYYDKAIEMDPNNLDAIVNKGAVLASMGRDEDASDNFRRVLEIDFMHVGALVNMGLQLIRQQSYEDALNYLDKALAMAPSNLRVLVNKGYALYFLGQDLEALYYFDRALLIDPTDMEALGFKGIILCGQYKTKEALEHLDRALLINPNDGRSRAGKGIALYLDARAHARSNDLEKALVNLERAIEFGGEVYKTQAIKEKDFDNIRTDKRFNALLK